MEKVQAAKAPTEAANHLQEALHLFSRNDWGAALGEINKSLALDPTNMDAIFLKSEILAQMGNHAEAIEFLKSLPALKESPEKAESITKKIQEIEKMSKSSESKIAEGRIFF